jgi:flagellar basal-body rod protein FlgB
MGLLESEAVVQLLGIADRRHSLIANNLANLNTPGYRTLRLQFTEELEKALDAHGRLLPGRTLGAERYRPLFADAGADGNDVTLARELGELNANTLRMRAYLAILNSRIHRMKAAIDGR